MLIGAALRAERPGDRQVLRAERPRISGAAGLVVQDVVESLAAADRRDEVVAAIVGIGTGPGAEVGLLEGEV